MVYSLRTFITVGEPAGQIGDMFGAANALFSGLAIIGLLYTIMQQREDLDMQREELKLTRDEHARSAEAQLESAKALARQAESLKQAARISAITTLVDSIDVNIELIGNREYSSPAVKNSALLALKKLNDEKELLLDDLREIYNEKHPR